MKAQNMATPSVKRDANGSFSEFRNKTLRFSGGSRNLCHWEEDAKANDRIIANISEFCKPSDRGELGMRTDSFFDDYDLKCILMIAISDDAAGHHYYVDKTVYKQKSLLI